MAIPPIKKQEEVIIFTLTCLPPSVSYSIWFRAELLQASTILFFSETSTIHPFSFFHPSSASNDMLNAPMDPSSDFERGGGGAKKTPAKKRRRRSEKRGEDEEMERGRGKEVKSELLRTGLLLRVRSTVHATREEPTHPLLRGPPLFTPRQSFKSISWTKRTAEAGRQAGSSVVTRTRDDGADFFSTTSP